MIQTSRTFKETDSRTTGKEKILLVLLPYWTPLTPPMGLSCLKSFLHAHGYPVKTVDTNIEDSFKNIYKEYFTTLKATIPENKKGNFYNIGKDVLQNHMMACFNMTDQEEYKQLAAVLIEKTFFCQVDGEVVERLNRLMDSFYLLLQEYFLDLLDKEKPDVLGVSVYEGTLPASLFAAKLTKENYPHVQVVMGGGIFAEQLSIGSPGWNYFLERTPYLDKIIIGEGENLFLGLLKKELPQNRRVYTLEDIKSKTLELSSARLPDFSDFSLESYPYIAAYGSRSCSFQCKFCSETVQWGKFRKKDARQTGNELKQLSRHYNRQIFLMCDSLLNPIVSELAAELKDAEPSIYWDGYLRVGKDVCRKENTLLWRQGGLYRARLGIESGSPRILEKMNKKITVNQVETAISNLAFYGIKTTTYWIIGYPGETDQDFLQTLALLERLKDNIYEAWCSPFYYFPTGQVNSRKWSEKSSLVYPEKAKEMLILQTWRLDCEPSREETYRRVNLFVEHCRKLGIPNPFFLHDFYQADIRWKKLHTNTVPSLVDFKNNSVDIAENKYIEEVVHAQNRYLEEGDFNL